MAVGLFGVWGLLFKTLSLGPLAIWFLDERVTTLGVVGLLVAVGAFAALSVERKKGVPCPSA